MRAVPFLVLVSTVALAACTPRTRRPALDRDTSDTASFVANPTIPPGATQQVSPIGCSVSVQFSGTVTDVTGTPLGLNAGNINLGDNVSSLLRGMFFDACVEDTDVSPTVGNFPQNFADLQLQIGNDTIVASSSRPTIQIENVDGAEVFRWIEGGDPNPERQIQVGTEKLPSGVLTLELTNTQGDRFINDSIPQVFPFAGLDPATFDQNVTIVDDGGSVTLFLTTFTQR